VVSPILANIYLHELDGFVESLIQSYTKGRVRRGNPEYKNISYHMSYINKDIQQESNSRKRDLLLEQKRTLQARQLDIPSAAQHDPHYRRLKYCRYADDFVLGVIGPKEEAEAIARKIEKFLNETLKLNISQAKSGLKHHSEIIRFLGYDLTEINSEKVRKQIIKGQHCKRRAGKAHISLYAPEAKLQSFATKCKYGNWETMEAAHNPFLAHVSDAEITLHYSAEMRGIAQYYALADNFSKALGKLRFLWMQSFLKTMANKYKSSMQKMSTMLNRGSYYAVRVPGKDGEVREVKLFDLKSVDRDKGYGDAVDNHMLTFQYTLGTELLERMQANECEYCGRQDGYFEVHHVRKLADIQNGKAPWQLLMIARRRKTLVLCISCHVRLHHGTLPDWRHWKKRHIGAKE
jgi:hypothetical protein